MMNCLLTNKICPNYKKKCKKCRLDDCNKTMSIIEEEEKEKIKIKVEDLKSVLPKNCKSCNMLEIIDLEKQKVYCPFMIYDKCIIN